uniref:S49 family peptidase n=1 Tax=Thiocapsa sp. TaxID=2024551 RepID=UPI0025E39525
MANDGVAITHIFAGSQKVDGTPYQPLPAAVRDRFQSEIDTIYGEFVAAVATGRPLLSADAVRATQAGIFRSVAAVDAGLADRIETTDSLITRLGATRARSTVGRPARFTLTQTGDRSMSETTDAGVLLTSDPTFTPAELAAARQAGADAERIRIFAILDHAEAVSRRDAALVMARNPAMDATTAGAVLAALPVAATPAPAQPNALALQMAAMGNPPTIGGDTPEQDPDEDIQASWARARGLAA